MNIGRSTSVCPRRLITGLLVVLLSSVVFAGTSERSKLIAERDAILTAFVHEEEGRYQSGIGNDEALCNAKIALYSFRRDVSAGVADKIANQELIVALLQMRVKMEQSYLSSGTRSSTSLLRARDRVLEAQILLEDIKAAASK